MVITRIMDGAEISIKLTEQEMIQAYWEQQRAFDRENVLQYARDNEEAFPEQEVMQGLDEIASEFRRIEDGRDWWTNMEIAFLNALGPF